MSSVVYKYSQTLKLPILFFLTLSILITFPLAFPLTFANAATPIQQQNLKPINLVSLGDSFASGIGVKPIIDDLRNTSGNNYAHELQRQLKTYLGTKREVNLIDVASAGATTDNIVWVAQQVGSKTFALQDEVLDAETDIVTISIGGNDMGFADIIPECVANSSSGNLLKHPFTANCESILHTNGVDDVFYKINDVMNKISKTYSIIRDKAPNAKIFVVGYPALMPDAANTPVVGCFRKFINFFPFGIKENSFPFTDSDVEFLHSLETTFDQSLRKQADNAGFTYISQLEQTLGASACVPESSGRLVNDLNFSYKLGNFMDLYVLPSSFHPNVSGHMHTANMLFGQIRTALLK